jgi:HEAT repeat protein
MAMADGFTTTFELLAETRNEAATAVLIPALGSADAMVQERALRAIMQRRSPAGQREVLSRLHQSAPSWRKILQEYRGRMTAVLRDAVLGQDRQMCANGCQAIVWFREYDLTAALITAAEDETNPNADTAAATIVQLAAALYDELAGPRDYRERRDPQLVRQHVVTSLEGSVKRYSQHRRRETIEAFLMLAKCDNAVLRNILRDLRAAAYLPVIESLTHSPQVGVHRLVLGFLDDPHAPSAVLSVISHRGDLAFVRRLLAKIGVAPAEVIARHLKRVEDIVWLRDQRSLVDQLDDAEQSALVQLVTRSGMKRLEAFKTIEHLVQYGKTSGRRTACEALADYSGGDANQLVERSLSDSDPDIQASAARQLRERGMPDAMSHLIDLLDSPHAVVREAARSQLSEFTLERYLAAFDGLDDAIQRSTGKLVRKVDPGALAVLAEEMVELSRARRLRAIAVARALQGVVQLEQPLLDLLTDDDHMVRTEAASALSECDTPVTRSALHEALDDRSMSVRVAAQESLEALGELV